MPHSIRSRFVLRVCLPALLLVLGTFFLAAPLTHVHADASSCGQTVNITYNGTVVGTVTKGCSFSNAWASVHSYLSPTTTIAAWVSNPGNTGTRTASNTTYLTSDTSYGGAYYPACGVVSNGSIGGQACTS